MRILVSNDDGYRAAGIRRLADALAKVGDVTTVAPDRDRSGASNALTLHRPIRCDQVAEATYRVDGTPTDCVHLAITGLLASEPDMVVSGINAGPNLGDDVLYSGTVAAAMEGRFLGLPAIAISLASSERKHIDTAARVAVTVVERLSQHPLPADIILNINVPDLPWESVAGFRSTRLGYRHPSEPAIRQTDPRGRTIYWVGMVGQELDAGPGTDFEAVRQGFVSVTPLKVDLTRYEFMDQLSNWLADA